MLSDYELELTTEGGQAITATAYGTKYVDQKALADPAIGEPLALFFQVVTANFNTLTSLDIALMGDTDLAHTSEVTLLTRNYLLAALTTALGVRRVGIVPPGIAAKRGLWAKFTVNGTNPTTGAIKAWIGKATDISPQHSPGINIGSA